jgi:hypothetical protein
MMEALRSSVTSVLSRFTRRNIPDDDILQGYDKTGVKKDEALAVRPMFACVARVFRRRPSIDWYRDPFLTMVYGPR